MSNDTVIEAEECRPEQELLDELLLLGIHALDGNGHYPGTRASRPAPEAEGSACSRALATPELLIMILCSIAPLMTPSVDGPLTYGSVDPRSTAVQVRANNLWTLLHSQRVNHTWRNLIRSTPALQRCLFVAPQTTSWRTSTSHISRPVLNPLIQTFTHWRYSHLFPEQPGGTFSAHMIIERNDFEHLLSLPLTQQNMLLSQPSVTELAAVVWDRSVEPSLGEARVRPPSSFYSVKHIRDDGGIRFASLLDSVGRMFDADVTLNAIKIES